MFAVALPIVLALSLFAGCGTSRTSETDQSVVELNRKMRCKLLVALFLRK